MYSLRNNRGFTLLELFVVMSLIGLLAMIATPTYLTMQKNVALSNQHQEVINALRLAQQRAIISQNNVKHGVHFDATSLILFGGDWTAPTYSISIPLRSGLEVIQGVGSEVAFSRLTGTTSDQLITIGFPGGEERGIAVSASGAISVP